MRNQIFLVIMKKRVKVLCKTDTSPTYPISRYVKKRGENSISYSMICTLMFFVTILPADKLCVCMFV